MFSSIFKTMICVFFSLAVLVGGGYSAQAALINVDGLDEQNSSFVKEAGFDTSYTIGTVISMVIQGFLSLLAIIFLILMLVAGYKWMTAGGNEEKVKEAKSQIQHAIIGLAIIIMAYAITYFVFEALGDSMGGGGESYPL
jgi:uncharacterized membrane protein YjgN (DUF898 family)